MRFRTDLEGLRGIAVALVVLFHFDLLGARGGFVGVDVFYVLSGFLITSLLLRELTTTGTVDLVAFYARRARRILPAAAVALVAVLVAASFIVAPLDLPGLAMDASSCALFVCNITFASHATDYFASQAPSPLLHYWSLGVEEQFYLIWPLVLLVAFRVHRPRLIAWLLCGASFAAALGMTELVPQWAFFTLPSRAWELGAGALVALHAPTLERIPRSIAVAIGCTGVVLLAVVAATFDHAVAYPGFAALAPTTAVVLIIAAGARGGGASRVLTMAPLRWLGRVSYSLYLYHWPVFVLAGDAAAPLGETARWALVAVSLVLAILSRAVVEEHFLPRRAGRAVGRRPLAMAAGATALVLLTAQLVTVSAASSVDDASMLDRTSATTSETLAPNGTEGPSDRAQQTEPAATLAPTHTATATPVRSTELEPRVADARGDVDGLSQRGCGLSLAGDRPPLCDLGRPDGRITVALIGDSHAAHWFPAVDAIATAQAWRVVPLTKDSCIFEDTRIVSIHLDREYTECERWRTNVVAAIHELRPDLVIVSSSRWVHPVDARDSDPARQAADMSRLVGALGTSVVIIADTPLMSQDIPACLSRRDRDADACATSRGYALTLQLERDGRAAEILGATLVDPARWLCDDAVCPAVIDHTIVYRDDHHLTATMARRLAPLLEPALLDALR